EQLEPTALRQQMEIEKQCSAWDQSWADVASRLNQCLHPVRSILRSYDSLLSSPAAPEEVTIRLTRTQRESLDLHAAKDAARWLEANWPPPSDRLEAVFALWELGVSVP